MKSLCVFLVLSLLFVPAALFVGSRGEERILELCSVGAEVFPYTVILDAGHGGEDGGAVAIDGTVEKDLNLAVARMIGDYFELFGIPYIAVRKTDCALGDVSLPSIKARKASDIQSRFALVNHTPESVLLSIHQNMFSQEKYSGTQVFYAPKDPASEKIAESIQKTVKMNLQEGNEREVKPSGDSIYLLFKAKRPSVLVECGFLSNLTELEKLKTASYQSQLAYFITEGFYFGIRSISIS